MQDQAAHAGNPLDEFQALRELKSFMSQLAEGRVLGSVAAIIGVQHLPLFSDDVGGVAFLAVQAARADVRWMNSNHSYLPTKVAVLKKKESYEST